MARNSFAILRWLAILIFISAGVKVSWDMWHMLLFEMSALNTDAYIYLTVGRGILNGLRPYTDLFESKPPGIFYLNALSLWLTNGTFLLRMFQAGNLLSLPIVLTGFVWFHERTWNWRTGAMLFTAFIMGCLLASGAEENAPGLQTEVFGVLPSVLYALGISGRTDWKRTIFSGFCIFLAVIVREPFILGVLAAALLASKTSREFLHFFVFPALIAGALVLLFLLMSGLFGPYLHVYLPGMLNNRVQGESMGPIYLRALWVKRLFGSLTTFSTMPLIGYVISFLWVYAISTKVNLPRMLQWLTGLAAVTGVIGLHYLFTLFTLFYKAAPITPWEILTNSTFWPIALLYLVGIMVYGGFVVFLLWRNWRAATALACGLCGLPLLDLAIGLGGYGWRYMLYIIPVVVVLFFIFIRKRNIHLTIVVCLVLCAASLFYRASRVAFLIVTNTTAIEESNKFDAFMKDCGFKTYASANDNSIFAFSRYSPIGPIFIPYAHAYLTFRHPLYQQTYQNILTKGQLLIIPKIAPDAPDPIPGEIRNLFAEKPPLCARGTTFPGYTILYRK